MSVDRCNILEQRTINGRLSPSKVCMLLSHADRANRNGLGSSGGTSAAITSELQEQDTSRRLH